MRFLVLLLAACNQVYGLDPTSIEGTKECTSIRFGVIETLLDGGLADYDPQLNADGTELYYTHNFSSDTNLYRATRSKRGEPFGPGVLANPSTTGGGDPSLTADGTRLFMIDLANRQQLLERRRTDPTMPFADNPRLVEGITIPGGNFRGIDISRDGLTLYYVNEGTSGQLWTAHRRSIDDPFQDNRMLLTGVDFPTISPDEREVFYTPFGAGDGGPIVRRFREETDRELGPEEVVLDNAADPDISPDAEVMTVYTNGGIAILSRECP